MAKAPAPQLLRIPRELVDLAESVSNGVLLCDEQDGNGTYLSPPFSKETLGAILAPASGVRGANYSRDTQRAALVL